MQFRDRNLENQARGKKSYIILEKMSKMHFEEKIEVKCLFTFLVTKHAVERYKKKETCHQKII